AGERLDRRGNLVVDVSVHGAVRDTAGRSQMRVAEVDEDAVVTGARCGRDAIDPRLGLRVGDPGGGRAARCGWISPTRATPHRPTRVSPRSRTSAPTSSGSPYPRAFHGWRTNPT